MSFPGEPQYLLLTLAQWIRALKEGGLGKGWVHHSQSGVYASHGIGEVLGRGILHDKPSGTGIKGCPQIARSGKGGDDQHSCRGACVEQACGGGNSVITRHLNIHQTDIRLQGDRLIHRGSGICGEADRLQVVFEVKQCAECAPNECLVIDDQESNGVCRGGFSEF